jgi:hypothetical protein
MTRDETKKLLKEITVLFPRFMGNDEDKTLKVDLWNEVLQDDTYSEIHDALVEYTRSDNKGFAPTAGQLIELTQDPLCPPDHVNMGVWKEGD